MKRTFIACPLSKEFLSSYETDITPLLLQEKSIKAVSAENMHITLKFLGDTEDRLCPEIASALGRDLAHVRSCGLFFSGSP